MFTLTLSSYFRNPGESYPLTVYSFSNDRRLMSTFFKKFISNMLCFCQYHHALLRLWFQTDLRCKNSVSFFKIQVGKTFYNHGHAPRPIFMLWLVKIWQVSSYVKFMQHLESCFSDSWSWQSFELTCDVFNCLFPLDVKNEIQSVLLFMAGLFIGFLVEKCVACQSR